MGRTGGRASSENGRGVVLAACSGHEQVVPISFASSFYRFRRPGRRLASGVAFVQCLLVLVS